MKHQNVYNRLRRIEGQIRGIEEMVAKERSLVEILIQLEAAKSSLSSVLSSLIEETLEKDKDGLINLTEPQAKTILRLIKKN